MPRDYGPETHESQTEASYDAGNEAGERFRESQMGDVQPDGEYDDSAPEYPKDVNPDDRYTP